MKIIASGLSKFQHTAARRRLVNRGNISNPTNWVSTHSRPKAAGTSNIAQICQRAVSTHSRPKAAGTVGQEAVNEAIQFQHTAARRRLVWLAVFTL